MYYFDIYLLLSRITFIWMLISIITINKVEIYQMNIKKTFFKWNLDEEVYMEQPNRFVVNWQKEKVCKFVKSLYDLKQTPKK
jgi:hypothetical protein